MLKLKYLFENYDLAKEVLNHWEHDEHNLAELLTQFRISSNAIYPFSQNNHICFLRLAPLEEKQASHIAGELEFIEYLRAKDFPALEPLKTKAGDIYLKVNTKWGDYHATVFKKVPGIQMEDTDCSDEIMLAYGKTLGRLHFLSSEFKPTTRKWSHIEVMNWIKLVFQDYKAKDYMLLELTAVAEELANYPIHDANYGFIHYDFELDNVFYDHETKTCSVIDFDDSMYHWYVLDIEQVFDSLEDQLDRTAFERAKREFINGYQTEYCYTDEMEAMRPLMRRFINLYKYARLIRCIAEEFSDEPEWLIHLREKLNHSKLNIELDIKNNNIA